MELLTFFLFWFFLKNLGRYFSNIKPNPSKKITLSLSVTRALFQLGLSIYVLKAFGLVAFMAFTFNGLVRLVMCRVSKIGVLSIPEIIPSKDCTQIQK